MEGCCHKKKGPGVAPGPIRGLKPDRFGSLKSGSQEPGGAYVGVGRATISVESPETLSTTDA